MRIANAKLTDQLVDAWNSLDPQRVVDLLTEDHIYEDVTFAVACRGAAQQHEALVVIDDGTQRTRALFIEDRTRLREPLQPYPAASALVHVVSGVHATRPRWDVQRSRAFPRASSPKATSRSWQPGPLIHDAVSPEHFVLGSSLPCL